MCKVGTGILWFFQSGRSIFSFASPRAETCERFLRFFLKKAF